MEPLLLFAADFWWVAPIVIGGGAASVAGLRSQRRRRARTIEYAAARQALGDAQTRLRTARGGLRQAEAALLIAKGERQSGRAGSAAVEAARLRVVAAQSERRAAQTNLRGRRMQVQAARTMLRGAPRGIEHLPLARVMGAHDAIVARWMEYETDPAKAIAFPAMSDARVPSTAALLTAMDHARWLRPPSPQAAMTPNEYARYSSAVAELETAFATAESEAWRAAGAGRERPAAGGAPEAGGPVFRDVWDDWRRGARNAAAAMTDAAIDSLARARMQGRGDAPRDTDRTADDGPADAGGPQPTPPRSPVWPIPRRDRE